MVTEEIIKSESWIGSFLETPEKNEPILTARYSPDSF